MKLKYYLRGLGIGIIVTTIVLMISFSKREASISDEEVIARATQLGMLMKEEEPLFSDTEEEETSDVEKEKSAAPPEDMSYPQGETEAGGGTASFDGAETGAETSPADAVSGSIPPQESGEPYRLTIHQGDVCRVVCETLAENGVVSDAETLRKYLFEIGYATSMSTGVYEIPYGLTNEEIAQILQAGPIQQ